MRVTIITPSKNQGNYIEHCLRSIHGQTHHDLEHIVLDGMSTDATSTIVSHYPCTFLQRIDSGPAQAINRGLNMTTGDIVCWLNADDVFWSSNTIEQVVRLFTEHPEVDVITGNGYFISENGKLLHPIFAEPDHICFRWIKRGDFILQPATFWRRNQLRLDESLHYCFDWKFWIDFWKADLNIMYIPQYFALYRVHSSSLTQQDSALRRQEVYDMARQYDTRKVQKAWCWFVWRIYQLSELVGSANLKRLAGVANKVMNRISGGRINSC